jgi:hypothetical protein
MEKIELLFLPGTYKASASISFDYETSAQSKPSTVLGDFKTSLLRIGNFSGFIRRDLAGRYGCGYLNRIAVKNITSLFNNLNIHFTWFSTGHVLLKGNENRNAFRPNKPLPYATLDAGFTDATVWRSKNNTFFHEPYSSFNKFPHFYHGDLAERMKDEGEDIQCHTFSHPYVAMDSTENLRTDLEDWQKTAIMNGFHASHIFAFPFLGDYYISSKGKKMVPAKVNNQGEKIFLSEDHIRVFIENGFELFTRCGSLQDEALFGGFKTYANSPIFFMKDIGIMNFYSNSDFDLFLHKMINQQATVDFWLHPLDVIDDLKLELFKNLVYTLNKKHKDGLIWFTTIKEQWKRFKQIKNIDYTILHKEHNVYSLRVTNTSESPITQLAFDCNKLISVHHKGLSVIGQRLVIEKIESNESLNIELTEYQF